MSYDHLDDPASATDTELKEIEARLLDRSNSDPELARGLDYIAERAKATGSSFTEMFILTMREHMGAEKARKWLKEKLGTKA